MERADRDDFVDHALQFSPKGAKIEKVESWRSELRHKSPCFQRLNLPRTVLTSYLRPLTSYLSTMPPPSSRSCSDPTESAATRQCSRPGPGPRGLSDRTIRYPGEWRAE